MEGKAQALPRHRRSYRTAQRRLASPLAPQPVDVGSARTQTAAADATRSPCNGRFLKSYCAMASTLSYNLFFDGRGVEQSGSSSGS